MKISTEVAAILEESQVNSAAKTLTLPPGQLDRKLYVAVNKVLEAMGGKWNRKAKAHTFERDPSAVLENALLTGELVDPKKELQFFPTPLAVAEMMVELLDLQPCQTVLEPSAGSGSLLDVMMEKFFREDGDFATPNGEVHFVAVEIDPTKEASIKDVLCYVDGEENVDRVIIGDFMEMTLEQLGTFDRIIMNPPFTRQQDIKHVLRAFDFLKVGGTLVAVVSESPFFRQTNDAIAFRSFLKAHNAEVVDLMPGAFKESGTMVKTRIVRIRKL